jgi:diacylglycerol O-acyltransferase / wax synthase
MSDRMHPSDAVWYLGENPRNPMVVSSILWFDRPFDVDRWRDEVLTTHLDRHPRFRQRVVPSLNPWLMPRWRDVSDFNLDDHIEVIDLPAPGDHATLERLCSEQRSRPMDRRRPLWSIHVFRGYRGNGSAMHVRIHHSLGDGVGLMMMLLALSDEARSGDFVVADPPRTPVAAELLDLAEQSVVEATRMAFHPTHLARRTWQALDVARWSAKLLAPPMPAASSALIGPPNGSKVMAWDPDGLPLEEIKAVGRAQDATVNDVLLAVLTGGLRRYLLERDQLVDEVVVMIPINLRAPDQPLTAHIGNQIGLLPVRLPTSVAELPARLPRIQDQVRALRQSPAPDVSRMIMTSTALLTPPGERAIHRLHQLRSAGVVTNVPGPGIPLHLAGARIEGVVGWGGLTGHLNLSASFISMAGRVFIGIVTDEAVVDDPDILLGHVRDEWAAAVGALT